MATKEKLKGSFGSLIDTLTNRFDPLQPPDIVAAWTSLLTRCAASARNTEAWARLPDESPDFDPIIHALDDSTRAIVNADPGNPGETGAALQATSHALDLLEQLLVD